MLTFVRNMSVKMTLKLFLATFCFYDHGDKAPKAVQKMAIDQKEYHKCSSCVIIC